MNEVSVIESAPGNLPALTYTQDQVDLIKRMYAKDATNDELAAFMYASKRMNLDIIARQIHFTKRQGKPVFIVAIDGYRLNAERTGQYAPGREPSFTYDANGKVVSATAYVKKFIGGEWHEIAATAFMEEYKPSDDPSSFMWKKMPHNQLAKCAEALALRRAFPKDLGDTITDDEAAQMREPESRKPIEPPKAKVVDAVIEPNVMPAEPKDDGVLRFVPSTTIEKVGKNGPYLAVTLPDGKTVAAFDENDCNTIRDAKANGQKIAVVLTTNGIYTNIGKVVLA